MDQSKPFPAVLLAGSPHCGKSVLAYLLTRRLRDLGIAHYLLRAVPDGEGDWFLQGSPGLVREIRQGHKADYSDRFVEHMRVAVTDRALPLIVDVGGQPRGNQWEIIAACTHSILLYRSENELLEWQTRLAEYRILPLAKLKSCLTGQDEIRQESPIIEAMIAGLERDATTRRSGLALDLLGTTLAQLFWIEPGQLEQEHARRAPYSIVFERDLAQQIGMLPSTGNGIFWTAEAMGRAVARLAEGEARAIYGRGPVWLAAALAVRTWPADCAVFDTRYGWVGLPDLTHHPEAEGLPLQISTRLGAYWMEIQIPGGVIEVADASFSPRELDPTKGIVISGKLPRWLFAALARQFSPHHPWIGVFDPTLNGIVMVASHSSGNKLGEILPL